MKKLFALFLVVVMCAAMMVPAYAEEPTGTLTITNAEHGKTYYVIRAFDADASTHGTGANTSTSVSYTVPDSTEETSLYQLIKKNVSFSEKGKTILNPFQIDGTHDSGTAAPVSHKTPVGGQSPEFGRGWLYGMYKTQQWKPDASVIKSASLTDGALNNLVFEGLPYGYYLVFPEGATMASVISIVQPTSTIIDKNPRTPGDPDKKIVTDDGLVGYQEAQMGDVVTYLASFKATNYHTVSDDMQTTQITSYTVKDTATGVKYKGLRSAAIYRAKQDGGSFSDDDLIKNITDDVLYETIKDGSGMIVGYSATIPWVDAEGNSLYPSPCYVVLSYDVYISERALTIANGNKAVNTFQPGFVVDNEEIPFENPPSVTVYTSGLSIKKIDDHSNPLSGAKFMLSQIVDGTEVFYSQNTQTSPMGEPWTEVKWVAKEDGLEVEAKNSSASQTFGGLKSGTYYLYETKAPEGFYAPSTPWIINIAFDDDSKTFSAEISADNGVTFTDLALSSADGKTYEFFTTSIENTTTSPLPQTGAAGTTLLLVSGAVLFMGTMLLLVTKKRMYNENF